jgi:hypothetical protein
MPISKAQTSGPDVVRLRADMGDSSWTRQSPHLPGPLWARSAEKRAIAGHFGTSASRLSKTGRPNRREDDAQQSSNLQETVMRFMVIVKATADSEAGVMPSEQLLAEMGRYNEQLVKAGVMQAGDGLHPSSKGARVRFSGKDRKVIDGPFAETKELIAGFWIWQCESLKEAIDWVKRCPNPMLGESEIEIRQIFEAEDFGEAYTPELRERDERMRAEVTAQQKAR